MKISPISPIIAWNFSGNMGKFCPKNQVKFEFGDEENGVEN
jgi:hypothetical protein